MEHKIVVPAINESDDSVQGTIVGIMVKVGDAVDIGDPVFELETDKVTVEVPSTYTGVVTKIHVKLDDEVGEGVECLTLKAIAEPDLAQQSIELDEIAIISQPIVDAVSELKADIALQQTEKEAAPQLEKTHVSKYETSPDTATLKNSNVPAGPSSRRLARELGVDVEDVAKELNEPRISEADIKTYAKKIIQSTSVAPLKRGQEVPRSIPDVSQYGETWTEGMSKISSATSANMVNAWSTIPHAWLQEKIDITDLEQWRQDQKSNGIKLTVTVIIAKAIAVALKQFPKMNSSFDEPNKSIIYKRYIDIGIAVDTPHGLVVPSLRQVDKKSLIELSDDIRGLSEKSSNRKLTPSDLQGSGITLSNLGGIGLSSIFPIVNWPQVAIIGVAGSELVPKLENGELVERRIVTLTLGFDHRVINGAEGARFLVLIKSLLEDIRRLII